MPGLFLTIFELFINNYSIRASNLVAVMGHIEYFYNYFYALMCIILVLQWNRIIKSHREIKQVKIIIFFGMIAFVLGAINDLIVRKLVPNYPTTDQFIFLIFILSIWYASNRYHLMNLSSLITAEDIVGKITDIVIVLNTDEYIVNINQEGLKVLGYKQEDLFDSPLSKILAFDLNKVLPEAVEHNDYTVDEEFLITRSNVCLPVSVNISAVKDETGDLIGILIICQDRTLVKELQMEIDERKKKEQELDYLSHHDSLTGLYNRTFFEREIKKQKSAGSVIVCDLDGLKLINDTLGHDVGDQVLIKASEILKSSLHNDEILSRIGGDEFSVLIPHNNKKLVDKIVGSIHDAVNKYNRENSNLMLSLSLGSAVNENLTRNATELFKEADDNMYREKLNHIQSFRNTMVQGLMKTLEARDLFTEGHAERMKELVLQLGTYIGLPASMLTKLQLLAQFHDIGKIGITDSILFKPDRLSKSEMIEMQRHSEIGHRIAKAVPDLLVISDLILKHHERWDGTGYPLGIWGEEIPLECRVLAIIDAYDAMTNDRPYRKAMEEKTAMDELMANAGTQFDPDMVFSFKEMMEKTEALNSPSQMEKGGKVNREHIMV